MEGVDSAQLMTSFYSTAIRVLQHHPPLTGKLSKFSGNLTRLRMLVAAKSYIGVYRVIGAI